MVNEALETLKLSRTEFYRQVNLGRIPLVKIGRASRVKQSDVQAFIETLSTKGVFQ